jgi:hypothetical protein
MNATFVKYCSLCDCENLSISSFCEKCDADLMNVPIEMRRAGETDDTLHSIAGAPDNVVVSGGADLSKDAIEQGQLEACGQSELATLRAASLPNDSIELVLVSNPSVRFSIRAGQTVGRASKADVIVSGVPDLEYISRAHARFIQRRAQWYVQYIAEGNSVTVDGVESRDDAEIAIYDQSIVVLSFTAFTVKIP